MARLSCARILSISYCNVWIVDKFFSLLLLRSSICCLSLISCVSYLRVITRSTSFLCVENRVSIFLRPAQYSSAFIIYKLSLIDISLVLSFKNLTKSSTNPSLHRKISIPSSISEHEIWLMLSWLYFLKYAQMY